MEKTSYLENDVTIGLSHMNYLTTYEGINGSESTNDTNTNLPPLLSPAYRLVGGILVTIIFVVGLVGNILVTIVVWRARSMHTPTNCYLVSLAIADNLLLLSAPVATLVEIVVGVYGQFALGETSCAVMVFSQYLGVNVSSLSIAAFTVERYIAICHPMRAQHMCTVRRAKRIITVLWLFGTIYCAPWLGLATTVTKPFRDGTHDFCQHKLPRSSYVIYYMADFVIFYVFPLLMTCILYFLMARALCGGLSYRMSNTRRNSKDSNIKSMESTISKSRIQVNYWRT